LSRTNYGTSYWLDRFPTRRRPSYPAQRGLLQTDVAIVGGGAIGCVAAYVFAAAGIQVVLLEAGRLAHQQASRASGIIMHEPGPDFHRLSGQHGVRDSRAIYQMARRGSLEYIAAIKRLRIECGLQVRDGLQIATTPEGMQWIQKEYVARRNAGFDAAALKGSALLKRLGPLGPLSPRVHDAFGLVTHGNASVDPYRASLGFAKAAAARGAQIFERSPAIRIRPRRRTVEINTPAGSITASRVILATGFPTDDFKPLRRRFTKATSYTVLTPELGAAVRRALTPPGLIIRDTAAPDHWLHWIGNRILFSGADQTSVSDRLRERTVVQRAGQLMYELSVMRPPISGLMPEYAWDVEYSRTIDGVPYFGPHRNYPNHLFAFGGGTGELGLSFAAARILLRSHQGAPEKADEPFSFVRIRE
jgi:glycine/D-amino acid oxidase-like deaminating enzyme